jgi:LCP family protein required for cell wall assembly
MRLDPARARVRLLSLPRDLWTKIPGVGEGKINSAYAIGEREGAGAALARETVAQLLGIGIDYTAEIDFASFRSVIDSIGGVYVDVPRELYDPQYPTDDYGYTVAHFLPGRQLMDGEQALMFSRMRHPDSDFERMRRQQRVLIAVAERLRERGVARNIAAANELTAAVAPHVRTDMPPTLALRVLWGLRDVDPASVEQTTVDSNLLLETSVGGAYALLDTAGVLPSLGAALVAAE